MSIYLERAAELVAQAAKVGNVALTGEKRFRSQLDCARAYADLAAIDKGLLPDVVAAGYLDAFIDKARELQDEGKLSEYPEVLEIAGVFELPLPAARHVRRELIIASRSAVPGRLRPISSAEGTPADDDPASTDPAPA